MKDMLRSWSKRTLVKNTFWSLFGQGVSTLAGGAYFLIVTSALGAEQYGAFAAVLAACSILHPLASLGMSFVLVQHVARDASRLPAAWGNTLVVTITAATILILLLTAFHSLIFPPTIPLLLVGLTAVAEV